MNRAYQLKEEKLREAEELEQLINAVEPVKLVMDQLREFRRGVANRKDELADKLAEISKLEGELSDKCEEIAQLEASLTPEMRANYERLKEIVSDEPTGNANHDETNGDN
jgi:peptidoglycan hydrolase CwlO-like protein